MYIDFVVNRGHYLENQADYYGQLPEVIPLAFLHRTVPPFALFSPFRMTQTSQESSQILQSGQTQTMLQNSGREQRGAQEGNQHEGIQPYNNWPPHVVFYTLHCRALIFKIFLIK